MITVSIPTTDVNSESAVVLRWYVGDRTEVAEGQPLVEIETSKAILDISAPAAGVLLQVVPASAQIGIDDALGIVFPDRASLERHDRDRSTAAPAKDDHLDRITTPARRRAADLGIELETLAHETAGLITAKTVDAFAARAVPTAERPDPLAAAPGVQRVVVIGAGLGATQVIDIMLHDETAKAVAIVDDDASRVGDVVEGVPVIGGVDRAFELAAGGLLDSAVIAISTSVKARTRLRELCLRNGLPLMTVVDPSARIASGVALGAGNVICAQCHLGVGTVVGDNNFLSAFNSFDHHNRLGSDISTGPGCMASGLVTIGDRARLGTGVFIEPHVEIGAGAQIASGAIIVGSVKAEHAVKTRVVTTAVVPLRDVQAAPRQ